MQQQQQLTVAAANPHPGSKSPKRLSKAANNSLSEIFRKIGSKENTKEVNLSNCIIRPLFLGIKVSFIYRIA